MSHWLCVAAGQPTDPPSVLYPDVVAVAADESSIRMEPADGANVAAFGPLLCLTYRYGTSGWVNTQHFQPNQFNCLVTDSRLVVYQSRYVKKKPKTGFQAPVPLWLAVLSSDTETSSDQTVLAGHVRLEWVAMILSRGPDHLSDTVVRDWGALYVLVDRPEVFGGGQFRLELQLTRDVSHELLAQDLVRRVRARWLSVIDSASDGDEVLAAWMAVGTPSQTPSAQSPWLAFSMPYHLEVGGLLEYRPKTERHEQENKQ